MVARSVDLRGPSIHPAPRRAVLWVGAVVPHLALFYASIEIPVVSLENAGHSVGNLLLSIDDRV